MDIGTVKLIEFVLLFGLALGWGFWELRAIKRMRAADAAEKASPEQPAGHSEGEQRAD